jgi:predicted ATPase
VTVEHECLDYFRDVIISRDQPPLAQVVHEKTAVNPFFGIQFISALTEEALLTFDHRDGR